MWLKVPLEEMHTRSFKSGVINSETRVTLASYRGRRSVTRAHFSGDFSFIYGVLWTYPLPLNLSFWGSWISNSNPVLMRCWVILQMFDKVLGKLSGHVWWQEPRKNTIITSWLFYQGQGEKRQAVWNLTTHAIGLQIVSNIFLPAMFWFFIYQSMFNKHYLHGRTGSGIVLMLAIFVMDLYIYI